MNWHNWTLASQLSSPTFPLPPSLFSSFFLFFLLWVALPISLLGVSFNVSGRLFYCLQGAKFLICFQVLLALFLWTSQFFYLYSNFATLNHIFQFLSFNFQPYHERMIKYSSKAIENCIRSEAWNICPYLLLVMVVAHDKYIVFLWCCWFPVFSITGT